MWTSVSPWCRATSAQRTSISRLFQFAAYQTKAGTDGLCPAKQAFTSHINSVSG